MICEEFRDRWEDHERPASDRFDHRSECAACASWVRQETHFDGAFQAAMVLAPPPELIERLSQIPAKIYATDPVELPPSVGWVPSPYSLALEAALIAAIGFAAIAFGGFVPMGGIEIALARLGNVLQALPLVVDSLLPYLPSFVVTGIEALATLILVGLSIVQFGPDPAAQRSAGEPSA